MPETNVKRVFRAVSCGVSTLTRFFSPGEAVAPAGSRGREALVTSAEIARLQARLDRIYEGLATGRSAAEGRRALAMATELEAQLREARRARVRAGRLRRPEESPVPAPAPRLRPGETSRFAGSVHKAAMTVRVRDRGQQILFAKACDDLLSREGDVRRAAVNRLAELGEPEARRILEVTAAQGQDEDLQVAALDGLARLRDKACRPTFENFVKHGSHRMQLAALRGLLGIGDAGVIPHLARALRAEHPMLRRAAATYLGWLKAEPAAPILVRLLRDDYPEVREAAADALADVGGNSAVFGLICALGDQQEGVRRAAQGALGRICGARFVFDAEAPAEQRKEQIAALKQWWRQERVARLLQSPEEPVTRVAPAAARERTAAGTAAPIAKAAPAKAEEPAAPAVDGLLPGLDGMLPLGDETAIGMPGEGLGDVGADVGLGIDGLTPDGGPVLGDENAELGLDGVLSGDAPSGMELSPDSIKPKPGK